jgi:hypothetical protein
MNEPLEDLLVQANKAILNVRMKKYDRIAGPRVGDWLDTPAGSYRIAHNWGDSVQPTITKGDSGSFYLGSGFLEYSGGLGRAIPSLRIIPTEEKRNAKIWFFSGDEARANNGVSFEISFRVFRVTEK